MPLLKSVTSILSRLQNAVDFSAKPRRGVSIPITTGSFEDNSNLPFVSRQGAEVFGGVLAMNIQYEPILKLRRQIEEAIGRSLNYLKSWDPAGEAHITVITPVEFEATLSRWLSMEEIETIAKHQQIQNADLKVFGIGSGQKRMSGGMEETYFVLVESLSLRRIRNKIWDEYVRKGGSPADWDPAWFFPHITIGFTKVDIHEPDVLKTIRGSWDHRFYLSLK